MKRQVVITRASHQAESLIQGVQAIGALPILYPCIAISPPDDTTELLQACRHLHTVDWVIFTSTNTVFAIANFLRSQGIPYNWTHIKIAAIGSKTNEALQKYLGRSADFIPQHFTAEALAATLPLKQGEKVFLPQSTLATSELADHLRAKSADIIAIDAYQNTIGIAGDDVPTRLQNKQIDALTFTSGSTVQNFIKRIAPLTAFNIPAICIGSSSAHIAHEAGFTHVHYPDTHDIDSMIRLLDFIFDEVPHGNT